MDRRTEIILSEFADWSEDCKKSYHERYEDPDILSVIETHTDAVKESLTAHLKTDMFGDYDAHEKTKEDFLEKAYHFFRLRISDSYDLTALALWDIDKKNEKWAQAISQLQDCDNVDELNAAINSIPLKVTLPSPAQYSFSDIKREALKIVREIKQQDYNRTHGEEAVFARLGKEYAAKLIGEMLPKKKGAPKKRRSPDTFRSFQFGKIVDQISTALQEADYEPTSAHEVCRLLLGEREQVSSFERKEEINWAMKNYFRASNLTPRGFLNSISRGKSDPLVKSASRIK